MYKVFILLSFISVQTYGQTMEARFLELFKSSHAKALEIANEPHILTCDTTDYWNGTYRFTWLPSFANPLIITLERKNQRVLASAKFIELKRPEDYGHVISIRSDSVELEWKHWLMFTKTEINAALFWFLPENCIIPKSDGAGWIFEAVTPKGRKTVVIQSPRKGSSMYNLGLYLARLFEIEEL